MRIKEPKAVSAPTYNPKHTADNMTTANVHEQNDVDSSSYSSAALVFFSVGVGLTWHSKYSAGTIHMKEKISNAVL
jgi:hypothetical protein